jgi:calcineurin-like phosphoesterase family protein
MDTWIWSDLHLWHQNILKYETRPFKNVDEMTSHFVKVAQETVKPGDTLINLGDVAFKCNKAKLEAVVKAMPGFKILIKGNHDRENNQWYRDVGFDEVYPYPIIFKSFYILSHEAVYTSDGMPYVNCHGHMHGKTIGSERYQYENVCVECIDYKPLNFDTIVKKYQEQ